MSLSMHPFSLDPDRATFLRCMDVISPREKMRAERYRRAEVARRYVAAQGQLRIVLSEYTGIAPEKIIFKRYAHGKPYLHPEQNPGAVSFNLTHSHEMGVVALCRENAIGVDVEYVEKIRPFSALARRYFSDTEADYLNALSGTAQRIAFYKIWTLKESWLKATGLGIAGLGLIHTVPGQKGEFCIDGWGEHCCRVGEAGRPMDYRHFRPAPGYTAAYTRLYSSQTVSTR